MKRWLTSLFFLIALVASIPAGTPFMDNGMEKNVCPMKCCRKDSAKSTKAEKSDVAICKTVNCSTPTPTNSGSSAQVNFVPNVFVSENVSLFDVLFGAKNAEQITRFSFVSPIPNSLNAKYIQFQSFLI